MPLSLAEHAQRRPDADQFDWQPADDLRPEVTGDREVDLRLVHVVHSPTSHCSAGDVPLDGPLEPKS